MLRRMVSICLTSREGLSNWFPKWHNAVHSYQQYYEGSVSTSSRTLVVVFCLFNYSSLNGCAIISHCGFGAYFLNN